MSQLEEWLAMDRRYPPWRFIESMGMKNSSADACLAAWQLLHERRAPISVHDVQDAVRSGRLPRKEPSAKDRLAEVIAERDALAAQLAAIRGPHPPKSSGMLISLPGTLNRAAEALRRDEDAAYLAGSLDLLLEHLRLVRADPTRVGELLELWVDEGSER
jgi:hypothetical protein